MLSYYLYRIFRVELAILAVLVIAGMFFWEWVKSQEKQQRKQVRQSRPTVAQLKAAQRERERVALYTATGWTEQNLATIDAMTGLKFEQYIAGLIQSYGCTVRPTKATGDYGVDLVVNGRFAVQCKRQTRLVGTAAIQQVIAGTRMHGCSDQTVVISNRNYTPAARRMADMHGVMLFGRDNLPDMKKFWTALAKHGDLSA